MKYLEKNINVILGIGFVFSVFVFFAYRFPSLLPYQEQWQMFMFDSEYFNARISVPGGLSVYISEFFVQFFYNSLTGALILALLLGLMMFLQTLLNRHTSNRNAAFFLSFIPVFMVWCLISGSNVKVAFLVALIFSQMFMLLYPEGASLLPKCIVMMAEIIVLYWIAGPAVFVYVLYVATRQLEHKYIAIGAFVCALLCVLISAYFVPYPLGRLFMGVGFCSNIKEISILYICTLLMVGILPFVAGFVPERRLGFVTHLVIGLILILVSVFCMPFAVDSREYEVKEYDYLVRTKQWDKIVEKAKEKNPDMPLTVASLNLALAMKGQLSHAMEFFQNGVQGAFPRFDSLPQSSLMAMEIYYYVGLVNSSQRLAFEAQEALPDYGMSSRLMKRLVETNLINGQYEVARKYLLLMRNTLFYRKWADATMALLDDEDAISSHSTYGYLRRVRLNDDFLFSDVEIDKIMGQLIMHDKSNVMATQYLLLLPQLEGDQMKYQMYANYILSLKNDTISNTDSLNVVYSDSLN